MTEEKIIDLIIKRITPICAGLHLGVERNYRIRSSLGGIIYVDVIVLDQENNPIVVFEAKENLFLGKKNKASQMQKRYLHSLVDNVGALIGFITNGKDFLFVQPLKKSIYKIVDINGVVDILENIRKYELPDVSPQLLVDKMESVLSKYTNSTPALKETLDKVGGNIQIHSNNFSLSKDDEIKLIRSIIANEGDKSLCRYVTASSLFRTINDKQDSMCGLVVMNDKSECFFLDKLFSIRTSGKLSDMTGAEIDELNRFFINSLCKIDKEDDLTMWRLYGGDGKGVCIEYEVLDDRLAAGSDFYLMDVNYTDKDKNRSSALKIISQLKRMVRINGYKFVFTQYDIWKHFFKPIDFAIEQEVRLLYQKPNMLPLSTDEKWIYNGDYQITHPIIVFDRNKPPHLYPLAIKKIILGPKFAEIDTNIPQFKKLLREKGISNVEVVPSRIDIYR